ncbi:MAG TPA: ABC transporter ATP-binding protein [Alphaproteobacteria bacterium]|nr:ABC transporter ATP-binding protein [Alphaproteobacteria bacterium]
MSEVSVQLGGAPALRLNKVVRTYKQGAGELQILRQAELSIAAGEVVALVGPSGAGKSTLLHVAGLLEMPDGGDVELNGAPCGRLSDGERTALRREHLGFVYQSHHLLPEFSARENIMLPQMVAGISKSAASKRAEELLAMVGLAARADHRPAELSGGEQQRVAIARALANGPRVLLADEPTGNLDVHTSEHVFSVLMQVLRETGRAALIATHNPELARRMDRIVTLRDGQIVPA